MILLRAATIISPGSPHHLKKRDILVRNGQIHEIAESIKPEGADVIESGNLHVSGGWLDIGPQFGDPGFEHREGLETGLKAAAKGGYTAVAPFPNTDPVIHGKAEVKYLINRAKENIVKLYPIGAVSKDAAGVDIAEMLDMRQAGAVAFSDGRNPIRHAGLLERALMYVKPFNGLIIHRPEDLSLSEQGQMHEGEVSTSLGLKGIPELAEQITLERDLQLVEYSESKLLEFGLSAPYCLEKLTEARKKGLKAFGSVHAMHLFFTDEELLGFNTDLKVRAPIRDRQMVNILREAFINGKVDIVTSGHEPWDQEQKKVEFQFAAFGMSSIEMTYSCLNTALGKDASQESLVACLCENPRSLLGIEMPKVEEGALADLSLFDPDLEWELKAEALVSKGKNSAFTEKQYKGKVLGIISSGKSEISVS